MKLIETILASVQKIENVVKIVEAVLAGFKAFTDKLNENVKPV